MFHNLQELGAERGKYPNNVYAYTLGVVTLYSPWSQKANGIESTSRWIQTR